MSYNTGSGPDATTTTTNAAGQTTTITSIPAADLSPAGTAGQAPTVTVPSGTPPSGLESADLIVGTGREAAAGDQVTVQYVLATYSAKKVIQSSWTSQPFTFTLGEGQVIPGWDQGVPGMHEGGRRELIIPPSLGYGATPPQGRGHRGERHPRLRDRPPQGHLGYEPPVDIPAHIDALRVEGGRMADAAARTHPDDAVPTCPDWTVRDLVRHTGGVHRWATGFVRGRTEPLDADLDEVVGTWPADAELAGWLGQGCADLADALAAAPDDLQCWTFLPAPRRGRCGPGARRTRPPSTAWTPNAPPACAVRPAPRRSPPTASMSW